MNSDIRRRIRIIVHIAERSHLRRLRDTTTEGDFVLLRFEDIDFGRGTADGLVRVGAGVVFAWAGACTVKGEAVG